MDLSPAESFRATESQGGINHNAENEHTTGSLSWALQLQRYMVTVEPGTPAAASKRRAQLELLHANPTSASAWYRFLEHEEQIVTTAASSPSGAEPSLGGKARSSGSLSLFHLYQRATEQVPRPKGQASQAFLSMWLGYARHQWPRDEDDARDTFKALKNQHIGDGHASLYHQWAQLEASSGNTSKALAVIQKGLKERAEPASLLEDLRAQLSGTPSPPPSGQDASGTRQQHDSHQPQAAAPARNSISTAHGYATPAPTPYTYSHVNPTTSDHLDRHQPSSVLSNAMLHPHATSVRFAPDSAIQTYVYTTQQTPSTLPHLHSLQRPSSSGSLSHASPHSGSGSEHSPPFLSSGAVHTPFPSGSACTRSFTDNHMTISSSASTGSGGSSGGMFSDDPTATTTATTATAMMLMDATAQRAASSAMTPGGTLAPDGSMQAAWTPSRNPGALTHLSGVPTTPAMGMPSGNANNGGTGPLSASGAFNLAAGAAAVAALNVAAAGGNNTGPVGVGMRRFGFKSKALRVGGAGGGPTEDSEVLMQATSLGQPREDIQPKPVSKEPSTAPLLPAYADPLQAHILLYAAAHAPCAAAAREGTVSRAAQNQGMAAVIESDCDVMGMDMDEAGDDALAASRKRRAEPSPQVLVAAAQIHQPVSCTPVSVPHSIAGSSMRSGLNISVGDMVSMDGMSKRRMSPPPTNTPSASLGGMSVGALNGVGLRGAHPSLLPGQGFAQQPTSTPHQPHPAHAPLGVASTPAPSHQHSNSAPQPHTSSSREQQPLHHQPISENAHPEAATHSHVTDENQAPHPRTSAPLHPSRGLPSSTPAAKGSSSETPKLQDRQLPQGAEIGLGMSQPHGHPPSLPIPGTPLQALSAALPEHGRGRANADGSATPGVREPLRPMSQSAADLPSSISLSIPLAQPRSAAHTPQQSQQQPPQQQRQQALQQQPGHLQPQQQPSHQQHQQQPGHQQQPQQQQQQKQPQQQQPQQQNQQPQKQQQAAPVSSAIDRPERLSQPQTRALEDQLYVYVHGIRYQKLDCVGRGGSSKVYKVLGLNRQIYAMKRVRMQNKDPEAIRGFIDEITLLRQLRSRSNIIQLMDAQVFSEEGLIYMVLEYGDIDLARLLHNHEEARKALAAGISAEAGAADAPATSAGGGCEQVDENFIRLWWQQMLQAVRGIHDMKIVHSDLKPANFMLVQGQLKLIDFGIAKSIMGDTTSINRESQVGTLNYMSPEAIQGGASNPLGGAPLKVGRPSDIWSLGCILYQMIYGRTPFAELPFIPKMNAICNPAHKVSFPPCSNPAAVDAIQRCLDRNPRTRITMQELLDHAFLHPERAPPVQAAPVAVAGSAGLTEQQLKSIVMQIAQSGAAGAADIELVTRQVLAQLSASGGMQVQQPAAAATSRIPQQQQQQGTASNVPAVASTRRVPPPPPGPPPPAFTTGGGQHKAPTAHGSMPPPPPRFSTQTSKASAPVPSLHKAPVRGPAGGGMSDIAAAAAAAAARRGTRAVDAVAAMEAAPPRRPFGPPPVLRPTGSSAGGGGGMPMGAELQQAILRRREQLKSVPDPSAATGSSQNGLSFPLPRGSQGASNGAAAAPHAGVGASRGGGGNGGCGGGVQLVRGLEQFKPFQATEDAAGPAGEVDAETGSKTEFMQTSLSGRSRAP